MTNLYDNYELVECDEETTNNYLDMAEMEVDVGDQVEPNVMVKELANIMQFSAYNVFKMDKKGV